MRIRVVRLSHGHDLPLPARASATSAGWDVRAAVEGPLVVPPGGWVAVPTGLAVEVETGWELQVRPRSGLARRHGVTLLNSPGTIDADYRGEIQVLLVNHGVEPFGIRRGDRIAQLVPARVEPVEWEEADLADLPASVRGAGGFGSTGVD